MKWEENCLSNLIKNHTCEEGGALLKMSFWHLLTNLKKKIIIKKTVEVGQ